MSQQFLKPGVVTGEEYSVLVDAAKSGGFALPAVNVDAADPVTQIEQSDDQVHGRGGLSRAPLLVADDDHMGSLAPCRRCLVKRIHFEMSGKT